MWWVCDVLLFRWVFLFSFAFLFVVGWFCVLCGLSLLFCGFAVCDSFGVFAILRLIYGLAGTVFC